MSNWRSSNTDRGYFDAPGILTGGHSPGSVTVVATIDGISSNTVNVDVTAARVMEITVTPASVRIAKEQTQQLTATATYSDGTSSDVSDSVTWTPANPSITTVTPAGLLTGVDGGTTTVTASKDGIVSSTVNVEVTTAELTGITVTPATVVVAIGQNQFLTATATYSDGTSSDVSDAVTWTPADPSIAVLMSNGLLHGVDVGTTTVTAAKDGIVSNMVNVDVTPAVMTGIVVTPETIVVAKGQTQLLTAMATYSDGTSSDVSDAVTWTPANPSITSVTPAGLLHGVDVGTTTVTASKDGIVSNTVNVDVTAAVVTEITVTPANVDVISGISDQQLTAMATYSDGTSSDVSDSVTWVPVNTSIATVTPAGLLTGVAGGTTTVTALKDAITSNTVYVNVCGSLEDACIDAFDAGSGKLFTNTPSTAYLNSIGGSETSVPPENFIFPPFNWGNANTLCDTYNRVNLAGRSNWRVPTVNELKVELVGVPGDLNAARGWPNGAGYWSSEVDSSKTNDTYYFLVSISTGDVGSLLPANGRFATCVSEP
ncbi:Ig-like domain-containing protein [Photobacterium sp. GJ3]|uniref:Ig-like domain-containing protein n=1 Tax=Photobacterium sp. GJ3 TaxID=2829502 RepID=UPI001B8AD2F9|nr:Ig-like domain-containing protein [Photobacterium sp. GJ3]QUJ68872.1 Ig-like domain-containing protein [Photobacterium sp. GJ3]